MGDERLRADCGQCFGLCCVALPFARSADFAIDKGAGEPCPNLGADFGCGIHSMLRRDGFRGCTVYDCFGAGQQVAQVTFGGRDWRRHPGTAVQMYAVFGVMRQLHELLWYLDEALAVPAARGLHRDLERAAAETERLTTLGPGELQQYDVSTHRQGIAALLRRTSTLARATVHRTDPDTAGRADGRRTGKDQVGADLAGADLIGADLEGAQLRGACLRGAYLIGAHLRDADLNLADLIGADLRDTDLAGADLGTALFVTQPQLTAAKGDARTTIPPALTRPPHW